MNKILVEIYLAANNKTYELYIPLDLKISEVRQLVCILMTNLSDGHFIATDSSVLCDSATGEIYDVNMYVDELNLKNGSRLMLI